MSGAFSAVTHPAPSKARRSAIRVLVIIPRSPTNTSSFSPKSLRTLPTAVVNAIASAVLPGKRSIPTGRPSGSVSNPYSICARPRLPSREYPNAASSQHEPSTHEDDRSYIAIPPSFKCRRASFFSIFPFCASSQSIASYTSSVPAPATPRSAASVVSPAFHQRTVDSFDFGRTTRDRISA